jgi:hypothetical protein
VTSILGSDVSTAFIRTAANIATQALAGLAATNPGAFEALMASFEAGNLRFDVALRDVFSKVAPTVEVIAVAGDAETVVGSVTFPRREPN